MKFPKPHMSLKGYMDRWYIIPRNRWCNIYLHKITGNDGNYHHDHPWPSISICLRGEVLEYILNKETGAETKRSIGPGSIIFRAAKHLHRLTVARGPVWTLFVTWKKSRTWGFWTPIGWMGHERFARARRYCLKCYWSGYYFEGRKMEDDEERVIGWQCPACHAWLHSICEEFGCWRLARSLENPYKCAVHGGD